MCGIAGIVDRSDPNREMRVARMNDVLAHRGPDGQGLWSGDGISLGHRRLRIIDLSENGAQPMLSRDGRYAITFNGEIYNYRSLRAEIGDDVPWRSTSDTEVLLRAYEKWGSDCLVRLNGMFAFAIWDARERTLFAARDRFGIKPFYYWQSKTSFCFASEIKGLIAAGCEPEPNHSKIGEFLRWGALDYSDDTWFSGVKTLLPSHSLTLNDRGLRLKRYWHLPDEIDESRPVSYEKGIEEFSSLLRESLALQMQSDRTLGVHLSGGVDSSVVVALAAELTSGKLETYTFGYEEAAFDERPFASEVAGALGVGNQSSLLMARDVADYLPRVLEEEDEPFTSLRQLSHHKLYADFAKSGSTVILEASGGDEIGAGYSSYLWPNYLDDLHRKSPRDAARSLTEMSSAIGMKDPEQRQQFLLGSAANYEQAGICTSDGMPYLDPSILDADFEKRSRPAPEYPKPFKSNLRNLQYIDLYYTKLPRGLRYIERASMATGREARLPLLDHRIVTLGFALENEAKIAQGHMRRFMKDAVRTLLPQPLLQANKRSVADPQKAWLRGPLKELVADVFDSKSIAERGLFAVDQLRAAYDGFKSGDPTANSLGIFQPFIVEMWFRQLIDKNRYRAAS